MSENFDGTHYLNARKLALKEYSRSTSNGEVGYLPSLEGLISNSDIVSEVNLGLVEVPLNKIRGTYSHLRSLSFAKNFMPMLNKKSEFQAKWTSLYFSQLSEGIREPIKVYEYLNWFYVIEGNKRVSILKYIDAYAISAKIIRLIPKKDENNLKIKLYYEFLNFNKITNIFSLWFSKEHSYETLLILLENFDPISTIFDDKYKFFEVEIYQTFRTVYLANGGQRLSLTTADAFLEYAKIYGIAEKLEEKELQHTIKEFIIELGVLDKETVAHVITAPLENTQSKMFSALSNLVSPKKKTKVGFIYSRTIANSGWTFAHELGRLHLDETLGDTVITSYIEMVPENDEAYDFIKILADEGNDIIFTTSQVFLNATLKCAIEYPNVKFFNCSESNTYQHVTSYYGRTYEPRFLTGVIAGAMTKTDIIGYVATNPTPEVFSSINAFALGAKMVNPYVKVKVTWTSDWNSRERYHSSGSKLIKMGADIICNRTVQVPQPVTREYGVYSMLCSIDMEKGVPDKYLATPIWQWGIYYEKIVANIIDGTFKAIVDMYSNNSKLINFWWGIDTGVVDIFYSKELVPEDTQKLVNLMKKMISNNAFYPFTGPIYDQLGNLRIESEEIASHEQILSMDWLVDNVETEIPELAKG